jgi:hypothetical protein
MTPTQYVVLTAAVAFAAGVAIARDAARPPWLGLIVVAVAVIVTVLAIDAIA